MPTTLGGGFMRCFWVTVVLSLMVLGCASKGFNRGALRDQIGVQRPVVSDVDIKKILSKQANLPKPFKLAVYFKNPEQNTGWSKNSKWRWTGEDKDLLLTFANELKNEGIVSHVFPVLGNLVTDTDLKSIRVAAAKHGADAVLVIDGVGEIDRYINSWGWSYFLLVPALFVPGSEADAIFISTASMWDVRNEFLYLTAESESTSRKTHIAAFGPKEEQMLNEVKTDALRKLKSEIVDMVKGIRK
jgi:hypothetical protein